MPPEAKALPPPAGPEAWAAVLDSFPRQAAGWSIATTRIELASAVFEYNEGLRDRRW